MKVKELEKKYAGYHIIHMGYPGVIPFTFLPDCLKGKSGKEYSKIADDLEVKGYKVIDNPHTCISISHCLFGGKKKPNNTYKGTLEIYLQGNNKLN